MRKKDVSWFGYLRMRKKMNQALERFLMKSLISTLQYKVHVM